MKHLGDNSKFKQITGYLPKTTIEEGISKTISWFKGLPFTPKELLDQEVLRSWE
jgi:dTDP-D-glucose 4,6-dehydratase